MASEQIIYEVRDAIATITLNRPARLNAWTPQMGRELYEAFRRAGEDDGVRVIVVTGAGRGFCAGADMDNLRGIQSGATDDGPSRSSERPAGGEIRPTHPALATAYAYPVNVPKPVIGAINGPVAGLGFTYMLYYDLRIASDRARFGTAFARVGFGGDYGTTWQLTRRVGPAKAKELFFLAEIVPAEQAARLGLVNRVIPHDTFVTEVTDIARRIAHGPLVSYRYMKENVNLAVNADFRTVLDRESVTHLRCGQTADHKEGVAAFLEKREPRFQGR